MDPLWIAVAFLLGLAAWQVGLPPLVGFLVAGFLLRAFGAQGGEALDEIADFGVLLLLFSIGLKLRLRSLVRPHVWGGAIVHMAITVLVFGAVIFVLAAAGLSLCSGLDLERALLIAFALSFSSTVFAVKALEEKGEMDALHGRTSIGILIMQDLVAVVFLVLSGGKAPSLWALTLVGLPLVRPLLFVVLDRSGHGELVVLLGLLLAIAGAAVFELVGLKGDLGALVIGIMLAGHAKAPELARSLLAFKHLFLVGFFLSIGMSGAPDVEQMAVAGLVVVALPFKVALFYLLLTRFRLRARTSALASLTLANYSEFGLIVAAVGVKSGWIGSEWTTVLAIALSVSFVLAAPLNTTAHTIYARLQAWLGRFETALRLPDDEPIDVGDARVIVFGMGRIGSQAYDEMRRWFGDPMMGIDFDADVVREQRAHGRTVVHGDATDSDFWERAAQATGSIKVIMLAMSDHAANVHAARQLAGAGFNGLVAAIARHDDEAEQLRMEGIQAVFDFYAEAGAGFAEHVHESLERGGSTGGPDPATADS